MKIEICTADITSGHKCQLSTDIQVYDYLILKVSNYLSLINQLIHLFSYSFIYLSINLSIYLFLFNNPKLRDDALSNCSYLESKLLVYPLTNSCIEADTLHCLKITSWDTARVKLSKNVNLIYPEIFDAQKIKGKKCMAQKYLWSKKVLGSKNLSQKKFWVENKFEY